MWHNTRRGFNLIRKRTNDRNIKRQKLTLSVYMGLSVVVCALSIFGTYKVIRNTSMNNEENAKVEIYKDTKIKAESKTEKNSIVEEDINIGKDEDEAKNDNKNMALTALRRNNDGGTGWN